MARAFLMDNEEDELCLPKPTHDFWHVERLLPYFTDTRMDHTVYMRTESGANIKVCQSLQEALDLCDASVGFPEYSKLKLEIMARVSDPFSPEAVEGMQFFEMTEDGTPGRLLAKSVADYIRDNMPIVTFADTGAMLFFENGNYVRGAEARLKAACESMLGESATIHNVNEILEHIKRSTFRARDDMEIEKDVVVVENGILDLASRTLSPFDPERIFVTRIPVSYDPDATCPTIEKFMSEVMSKEDLRTFCELAGDCLQSTYIFQKALLCVGSGSNGKSVALSLLRALLGACNVSSVSLQSLDKERFAAADLYAKKANICADISADDMRKTAKFKQLTGGDQMRGEEKHKQPFHFVNHAKLVFSCNQVPRSEDDTPAFYRRWLIVHFPRVFEGKADDRMLIGKLTTSEELSGFLNLALEGLDRLHNNNGYTTASPSEIKARYIALSDTVYSFVEERCVIDQGEVFTEEGFTSGRPAARTPKTIVWKAYLDFCEEKRYPPVSDKRFKPGLLRVAPNVSEGRMSKVDSTRAWVGIRLNNDEPAEGVKQSTF